MHDEAPANTAGSTEPVQIPKRAEIRQAENGYIIEFTGGKYSAWDRGAFVAKSISEMLDLIVEHFQPKDQS